MIFRRVFYGASTIKMSAHLGGWSWVPFALQFRKRMQPEAWRYERTFDCCGPRDGGPSLLAVTSARTGLDSSRQVQVTLRRHAGDFDAPLTLTCMKVWSSLSARAQRVVRGSICIDRGAPSSVQGARLSASGGLPAPGNAPRPGPLTSLAAQSTFADTEFIPLLHRCS